MAIIYVMIFFSMYLFFFHVFIYLFFLPFFMRQMVYYLNKIKCMQKTALTSAYKCLVYCIIFPRAVGENRKKLVFLTISLIYKYIYEI